MSESSFALQPVDVRGGLWPSPQCIVEKHVTLWDELLCKIMLAAYTSHAGKDLLSEQTVYTYFKE